MFSPRALTVILFAWVSLSLGAAGDSPRITRVVPDAARPLPLSAVRLTGGPLKHAQDLDAKYLVSLESDRMLAYYRQRAGLAPKAPPYDGWDGDGRNLTGHIAGHYLSAVSLMWAATGDPRFKERADYIVSELKIVQDKQGDGFAGALAGVKEAFADVSRGKIKAANFDLNGLWSPWYTLHKTYAGLRDAYRHTGNKTALDVEIKFAEWAERVLAPMSDADVQRMLATEFGGMNEIFADLYADTGDKRWLNLSYRFEHHAVLDPLKQRDDPLDGLHGNTQVPKLIGSASRFGYVGDQNDSVAATFFWDRVVNHHSFATGGHGKDEYFREPDHLSHIVDGRTAETCNIYNMLKLTRRLFALQPDVKYAEFHERALFNHILGSIDPNDGAMCYMVPVGRGYRREYQDMQRSFTCCVGTGMESHGLHGDGIYYEAGGRLWVNLYVPSTARWDAAGLQLEADSAFPDGDSAALKLALRQPKAFTLSLRRPAWAGEGFRVAVNGVAVKDLPAPGSYVDVKRTWRSGDAVSLVLPKRVHVEPLSDNTRVAALMWGPLVLAGDLGPEPEPRERTDGEPIRRRASTRPAVPALVAAERPAHEWLRPVDGRPGAFRGVGLARDLTDAAGPARDVDFEPFYRLHRRVYAAYWDLLTPSEYETKVAAIAAERERLRKLDAATVASVPIGDVDAEKKFQQQGEETSIVRSDGRSGRRAAKWFSFSVPIDASKPAALVLTYNSDTRQTRTFEILVEGQRVGEQTIPKSSESRFFDVEYPIPADLVRDKTNVTVRVQGTDGNETAPVFGLRTIRAAPDR
jgi:DUF1680 family protein